MSKVSSIDSNSGAAIDREAYLKRPQACWSRTTHNIVVRASGGITLVIRMMPKTAELTRSPCTNSGRPLAASKERVLPEEKPGDLR